jgi:hypothetical protein
MVQARRIEVYVPRDVFLQAFGSLTEEQQRQLQGHGYAQNTAQGEYLLRCALVQLARDAGESVPPGASVRPTEYGHVEVVDPDDGKEGGFFDFL